MILHLTPSSTKLPLSSSPNFWVHFNLFFAGFCERNNETSGYEEALNLSTSTETTGFLIKTKVAHRVKVILIPFVSTFTLHSNHYTS
jgi:hypothetical protein